MTDLQLITQALSLLTRVSASTWKKFFREDAQFLDETGSRRKVIEMRDWDFLELAKPGQSSQKAKTVEDLLDSQTLFNSIPFLSIMYMDVAGNPTEETEEGRYQVYGHEGRHRIRALQQRNVYLVPVLLRAYNFSWDPQKVYDIHSETTKSVNGTLYGSSKKIQPIDIR